MSCKIKVLFSSLVYELIDVPISTHYKLRFTSRPFKLEKISVKLGVDINWAKIQPFSTERSTSGMVLLTIDVHHFVKQKSTEIESGDKNNVKHRPRSLVTSRFFPLFFPSGVNQERKSFHAALSSHFIRPTHHLFLGNQGRLLNLHQRPQALVNLRNQMNPNLRPLFYLCMHVTRCIFERRRLMGSPELAGGSFCLSIQLHT